MVTRRTSPILGIAGIICLLLLTFSFTSVALADSADTGTFGASFLQIPVGPRLIASTEVVAGIQPDASILFSNPAAMSGIRSTQMFITTASWLEDMQLSAAGLVLPLARTNMQLGFSSRLLYSGGLTGYDAALNPVSEESFYDLSFTTSISRHFQGIGLSLGLGLTYVREHLLPTDGNGYTFSFGATYRQQANSFHFFAKDIGGSMSFDGYDYAIDNRFVFGYGRTLALTRGQLNLGAQMMFTRGDHKQFQVGGEYHFNRYLTIRSALNQYWESPTNSSFPISGGMGFHLWNANIDYAYSPHSYFPATHMFSFTYMFGQSRTGVPEPDTGQPFNTAPVLPSSPAAKTKAKEKKDDGKKEIKQEQQDRKPVPAPKPNAPAVQAPVVKKTPPAKSIAYMLVAGTHGRMESAKAEARTLGLLKIPADLKALGNGQYQVVIGQYKTLKKAQKAAKDYEKKGYRFSIQEVAE